MQTNILNIEKVAERIKQAIRNNERIILYGDSDMDGISSTVIVEEAIKALGGKPHVICFPNREQDGYGITPTALTFLKDTAPALLIALDLGIGNVAEVEQANQMGFEVVIVDHHRPLSQIPNASIVVDPFQPGDDYPFKGFCNAGLSYVLAMEMLGDQATQDIKNRLAELAALGTISDMMPQIDKNKELIEAGLASLRKTSRLGLKSFLEILHPAPYDDAYVGQIIAALNSAESQDFKNNAYVLLTSASSDETGVIAQQLLDKIAYKQEQVKNIVSEVERRLRQKPDQPIIFEGDPAWKLVLAGSAASALVRKYQKPIFIFKKMDAESSGSVRSIAGIDSVQAMKFCADLLITYGGHPMASGFRVKNENLEQFKQRLIQYITQ